MQIPVDLALARDVRAGVAAAHRHDDVGLLGVLGAQALICERPALCRQMNSTVATAQSAARDRRARGLVAHELIGERAQRCAQERSDDVDPEVLPLTGCHGRAERSRGVQRGTGQRAVCDRREADRGGDRERGGRADRARVGGDAHDHEHQQRGQDELDHECATGGDARHRGAQIGRMTGPDDEQQQACEQCADELRRDVRAEVSRREVAGQEEAEADTRIEVRSGDVPQRRDRCEQDEEEDEADPERAERAVSFGVGDDGAAAGEDERERPDALGGRAPAQRDGHASQLASAASPPGRT